MTKRRLDTIDPCFTQYISFYKELHKNPDYEEYVRESYQNEKNKEKEKKWLNIMKGVWDFNKRRDSIIRAVHAAV